MLKHQARKRFGQNFLQDMQVIQNIIQAIHPTANDNLLEIGPGMGALTVPLLTHVNHLRVVEIDRDLQAWLPTLPLTHKLEVIPADALTLDYARFGNNLRVVGNLPYNISTPLLIHLLKFAPYIEDMCFMLQKEVVERMAAAPGSKAYGRLSVMLQYHCDVEHVFDVPPEAFDPKPKVDSAIVRLIPHKTPVYDAVDMAVFESTIAACFAMRRKTLNNNLKKIMSAETLDALGIDGSKRPEQITIEEFVRIAKFRASEYTI